MNLDGPTRTVKENFCLSGIPERIEHARLALGYTTVGQAHRAGAPAKASQSIRDWEAGVTVPASYLGWLAGQGVSADYLLLGLHPILRKDLDPYRLRFQMMATVAAGASTDALRELLDLMDEWEGSGGKGGGNGRPDGSD